MHKKETYQMQAPNAEIASSKPSPGISPALPGIKMIDNRQVVNVLVQFGRKAHKVIRYNVELLIWFCEKKLWYKKTELWFRFWWMYTGLKL